MSTTSHQYQFSSGDSTGAELLAQACDVVGMLVQPVPSVYSTCTGNDNEHAQTNVNVTKVNPRADFEVLPASIPTYGYGQKTSASSPLADERLEFEDGEVEQSVEEFSGAPSLK